MNLHQLSLFLENRPGQLRAPCKLLGDAGIDILTMTLADTAQFGIARFIVKDWERAKRLLEAAGMVVNVTEVVPIEVDDRPGGLAAVLEVIEQAGLGVEYMYAASTTGVRGKAAIVFRFDDPVRALAEIKARGLEIVDAEQLLAAKSA